MFACGRVRHADGRSQGRTRQAESVYRRARVSVEGPASHVFIRGRTVPEDALLETHRMRDGSWRRRSMEQAHRQEPLAQRLESDTIRAPRLRFVPVLSELRNHLRRLRIHHAYAQAAGPAPACHRSGDVLYAANLASGTAPTGTAS